MRTYDRVLAHGVRPPFDPSSKPAAAADWNKAFMGGQPGGRSFEARQLFQEARPVIVADDVARSMHGREGFYLDEFPCLAPPWPSFWIEYPSSSGRQRRGVWVQDVTDQPRSRDGSFEGAVADTRRNGYDGPIGWLLDMAVLIEEQTHRIVGPVGWVVLALDERGRCVGNRWVLATPGGAQVVDTVRRVDTGEPLDDNWLLFAASSAMQAIALLHCRNVTTDEHVPPEPLSRRHRRRHGRPLVRWRTLRLDVPRRSGGGDGDGSRAGMVGVHVVAGNFHHYGDCCPGVHEPHGKLFGRLTGVYWVPGHARGNPRRGLTVTDWDLRAGREAS